MKKHRMPSVLLKECTLLDAGWAENAGGQKNAHTPETHKEHLMRGRSKNRNPYKVTSASNQKRSFWAERSERSERSGASVASDIIVISSHVPIGVESQKRSENVHFRSHCYIRCEETSFPGERNLEDWQDVLHNSL